MASRSYEVVPEDDDEYQEYLSERRDLRRAALGRSYVTPAVVTMILYCCLWLPGLIANIVYLRAANQDMILARREPQGRGCLRALLFFAIGIPAILIGLAVLGAAT